MNDDVSCTNNFNSAVDTSTSSSSSCLVQQNFNMNQKSDFFTINNNNNNLHFAKENNYNYNTNDNFNAQLDEGYDEKDNSEQLVSFTSKQEGNIQQEQNIEDNKISQNENENKSDALNKLLNDMIIENVYTELIDDVIFGLLLQVHRAAKLDYIIYLDPDPDPQFEKQYEVHNDSDVLGIFKNINESNTKISTNSSGRNGQNHSSNSSLIKYECCCPNCGRNLAAIRFAPHLEKCMGMGRNSSRIATRRIANYNGDELDQLIEASGLIPNNRYVEPAVPAMVTTTPTTTSTNDDDLMSIINAVATASSSSNSSNNHENNVAINACSSSSSIIDVDASSSSSNCSITSINVINNNLKPPAAKKKRIQNNPRSLSNSQMTSLTANNSLATAPISGVQRSSNQGQNSTSTGGGATTSLIGANSSNQYDFY